MLKTESYFLLFLLLTFSYSAVYNRFSPYWDKPERIKVNRTLNIKIELLANFGTSEIMKQTAKQAILKNFSGEWPNTGNESNLIGEAMERRFGGVWMVAIFDIDFDAAYTIVKRSPSYMLFGVNERAILIAKEGNGRKNSNNPLL
ncbi:hypothetical protein Mgra_00009033 [Meloidogyne graminicola]|uniref:Uncharacterized protein n=1 Tax=Meloidogyne graminicola TaxID=189291 RepID=A0A8S9ZE17_9BILA|nr:hypothetical protein Mgra_00009033 [Meloidogyne graminicola]